MIPAEALAWLTYRAVELGECRARIAAVFGVDLPAVVALEGQGRKLDERERERALGRVRERLAAEEPTQRWCSTCVRSTPHTAALNIAGRLNCLRCGRGRDSQELDVG